MNGIRLKWFGGEISTEIRRELSMRLKTSAEIVRASAVKLVRVSVWETVMVLVANRRGKVSAKKRYKLVRSKPGQPPRKETGRLQNSIQYEVNDQDLVARVGTNVKYGAWLEAGTKWVKKRPWLSVAFKQCQARIARIFAKPMH